MDDDDDDDEEEEEEEKGKEKSTLPVYLSHTLLIDSEHISCAFDPHNEHEIHCSTGSINL